MAGLVARAAHPNLAIGIDILHLVRSGGSPADVAALDRGLIGYAQLCDGESLAVTAIGGSPSTGGPLEGEVIQFDTLQALEAATIEDVTGKIVFLSTRMPRTRDGSGYGKAVVNRSRGPFVAAKGALALLIRSVGTDSDRLPHTGMMSGSEPGDPVPSAAVSNPDADNLMIMLGREYPVRIRLDLDVGFDGEATSYNVVGGV